MRLIDADALKDAIQAERDHLTARGQMGAEHILCHHAYRLIDDAPTVDAVEVKHGHWIIKDNPGTVWYRVTCSECGEDVTSVANIYEEIGRGFNYCPNCGTKMDEVTE